MNAIDLLREQHQEVKALFEQFEQAEDPDDKQALFQELADDLAAHATIEEKIFYPAAYANETKEMLTEAVEEHLAMKRIVADLLGMTPDEENFDAKMTVLREQVEHHVEEEESELFAAATQALRPEELEALGAEMEELFEAELDEEPSETVPQQIAEAAPLK